MCETITTVVLYLFLQLNYVKILLNYLCHQSEHIFDKWNVNSVNCSVFSVLLSIIYYFTIYIQLKTLIIN